MFIVIATLIKRLGFALQQFPGHWDEVDAHVFFRSYLAIVVLGIDIEYLASLK